MAAPQGRARAAGLALLFRWHALAALLGLGLVGWRDLVRAAARNRPELQLSGLTEIDIRVPISACTTPK